MAEDIKAVTVDGSSAEQVALTIAEGQAAKPAEGPTAESIGVTPAQFDKFHKDGVYNWEGHAKELQFAADQKPTPDPAPAAEPTADDAKAKEVTDAAGLDWAELGVKIMNDGDISAEDYTALAGVGVPAEVVKEHIELLQAKGEQHVTNVFNEFGSEEQFEAAKTWAQANYTEAELTALENQLGQPAEYKAAVAAMKAKAGIVSEGMVNAGQSIQGTATAGYKSQAEMVSAMRDPRYRSDPAYRATVEANVAASKWDQNPRQHVG